MKLGLLTTDRIRKPFVDDFGEYPDMFARLLHAVEPELELVNYYVLEGEYPADIDEVDAYLITGSKFSVYEDEAWIHRLGEFIRTLHARKKPMVGICFGHQLLAHVLGGKTEKASVGWSIGTQAHQLTEAGKQQLGPHDGFTLLFSHQDQVIEPAPGTVALASTELCPLAVYTIDQHIFSVQGHPEFDINYARGLMKLRKERLGEDIYHKGIASLDQSNDHLLVAKWIVDFLNTFAPNS